MMMTKAESAQQLGLSAGMSETAAAHGEAVVESVKREKKARRRPDDGTEFCGVRRRRSGKHGAQIWERSWRGNVWLGTFGIAEEAAGTFDAAAVELRGAAAKTNFRSPAAASSSARVALVKEETAQEQGLSAGNGETAEERGDRVEAAERRKNRALPDARSKFENVHKYYYKRRKDSRDDGRTNRFFQQLEALHGPAGAAFPVSTAIGVPEMVGASDVRPIAEPPSVGATAGMDGMIREEAWREQEILAQERAVAATRDAAVLSFIQKFTGLTVSMPSMPLPPPSLQTHATPIAYAAAPPPSTQPQPSPRPQKLPTMPPAAPQEALVVHQSSTDIVMTGAETPHDASGYGGAALSSRWAKAEVQALIQLRNNLVMRRKGARGAIWEEISAGMRRMGYSRSSKQCRKKWWGMNYYYYKKVKQSNKKRPEESKTCPSYFHQLEALYRDKAALGSPSGAALPLAVSAPILHTAPQPRTLRRVAMNFVTSNDGNGHGVGGVSVGTQMQASNGVSVAGNRFVFSDGGGHAAEEVIKLETSAHSRVATGGAYMWYPAPIADDINPEHVQDVGLKQAPVAAIMRTAAARSDSRSGYRGVRLDGGRYLAQIRLPGRPTTRLQLGTFDDVEEAARAYDAAALMLYGAGAKTNFEQPPTGPAADDLPELPVRSSNITAPPASGRRVPQGDGLHVGGVSGGTQMQASNSFFFSDQSSMDILNDLPEPPVSGSTISLGVGAEVEEFLKAFTDKV